MARKRRQFNTEGAKRILMFLFSLPFAILSALTGIGAQTAETPMVHFMLGYAPDKASATGTAFAFAVAAGACGTMLASGVEANLGHGLLAGFCAAIGVMLSGSAASGAVTPALRRFGQVLGIATGLYVLGTFLNAGRSGLPAYATKETLSLGSLAIAAGICGFLSNLLQVTNGVLFVPVCLFYLGMSVPEAIALSLLVIALASLLPVLAHLSRPDLDARMLGALLLAGLGGGAGGGYLVALLSSSDLVLPVVFGISAMFLSAYALSKLGSSNMEQTPQA